VAVQLLLDLWLSKVGRKRQQTQVGIVKARVGS